MLEKWIAKLGAWATLIVIMSALLGLGGLWISNLLGDLADARATIQLERDKHDITRASLRSLEDRLADYIRDGEARRKAGMEALEAHGAHAADLREQSDAIRAEAASMAKSDGCRTLRAVINAKGL